jgi:LuxR family maltose regulon positive regulatory protein
VHSGHAVIARTKFSIPQVPNATIRRDGLLARLDAATDRPLTLVVGAPGSGKTSLLTQWVDGLDGRLAWMSCDGTDADAGCFWNNLVTSVGLAWTEVETAAPELVEGDDHDQHAVGLANELGRLGQPGAIVVDDFHLAGPGPAAMKSFLDALPPGVRLVLGSRSDPAFPVGRLRLQGRLLELRQAELRFTTVEARALLAGLGVEVTDPELEQITAVTEGWTAGVHLAGLWLRAHQNPAGLLRGLAETDRVLVDFLVNEVIELQPPEIVEFLTLTAELETFDAALCDAVRDRHDSAELLQRVDAANLFLVSLDRAGGWHRYHHLFGQYLQARLRAVAPERVPEIHRAAAEAYGRRGELMKAVHHSMRADDADAAVARLESYVQGTFSLEDQLIGGATARAWIRERGAAQLETAPRAVLACTIVLNATAHGDDAEPWLRQVEAREDELDQETRLLLHGAWSFDRLQHGDPRAAADRARRAEAVLEEGPVHGAWVEALPNMAIQSQLWLDNLDGVDAAIEAARAGVHPPVLSDVRLPAYASQVAALRGELTDAERLAGAALDAADELGLHHRNFGRAEPHLTLAMVATERERLGDAEAHVEQVMRTVEHGRRPLLELLAHIQLALIVNARGDGDAATRLVGQARAVLACATDPVLARVDQVDLRLALDRGDHRVAEALLGRLPPSDSSALLAARLQLALDDPAGALDILGPLAGHRLTRRSAVERGVLSALAAAGTEPARAHEALHLALARAEPAGFRRTFLAEGPALWKLLESLPAHGPIADYIADLLAAAHRVVPSSRPGTGELPVDPLSDREATVLRYLASRLTCTEIAGELYVSVNTVRSHVKAIYRKLGVNSRREAVLRGHALGIA